MGFYNRARRRDGCRVGRASGFVGIIARRTDPACGGKAHVGCTTLDRDRVWMQKENGYESHKKV
jgi:hypothetical protein